MAHYAIDADAATSLGATMRRVALELEELRHQILVAAALAHTTPAAPADLADAAETLDRVGGVIMNRAALSRSGLAVDPYVASLLEATPVWARPDGSQGGACPLPEPVVVASRLVTVRGSMTGGPLGIDDIDGYLVEDLSDGTHRVSDIDVARLTATSGVGWTARLAWDEAEIDASLLAIASATVAVEGARTWHVATDDEVADVIAAVVMADIPGGRAVREVAQPLAAAADWATPEVVEDAWGGLLDLAGIRDGAEAAHAAVAFDVPDPHTTSEAIEIGIVATGTLAALEPLVRAGASAAGRGRATRIEHADGSDATRVTLAGASAWSAFGGRGGGAGAVSLEVGRDASGRQERVTVTWQTVELHAVEVHAVTFDLAEPAAAEQARTVAAAFGGQVSAVDDAVAALEVAELVPGVERIDTAWERHVQSYGADLVGKLGTSVAGLGAMVGITSMRATARRRRGDRRG